MAESKETEQTAEKKVLGVNRPGLKLELKKTEKAGQVRQSFSHGRSKAVTVEVRKKRTFAQTADGGIAEVKKPLTAPESAGTASAASQAEDAAAAAALRALTDTERAARMRALHDARQHEAEEEARAAEEALHAPPPEEVAPEPEPTAAPPAGEAGPEIGAALAVAAPAAPALTPAAAAEAKAKTKLKLVETPTEEEDDEAEKARKRGPSAVAPKRNVPSIAKRTEPRRRGGKMTVSQALSDEERVRSLASVRRARERERRAAMQPTEQTKIVREVVLPEAITVQELANRMAERASDVIKSLMKSGIMATITQSIDADTAELIVAEFGHRVKRVAESDIEIGVKGGDDAAEDLKSRPPVVTVMGHVDHGKTSLLDALRQTDVAAHEAGGITQHIGAYQVQLKSGQKITFLDTPGHAAFTAMRARGATVTDIVVLVVAADDGVMPQTAEAIAHAKAAKVPIIVAINKIDKGDARPDRVRQDLLQYEVQVEKLGGEVLDVEISATKKMNLDRLEEAIILQSEVLGLTSNPKRSAEGVVIEARLERGRGPVTTVLVQRGTLHTGDIVVAGSEWGRVRALLSDQGKPIDDAGPSMPVEILGLSAVPSAGDEFAAVENEARAREIADYRQRRARDARASASQRGTLEQMFSKIQSGEQRELAVVIKTDVQGSAEAISSAVENLATDEVGVRLLHSGVGGINESDITLAKASDALVIGFNVRASPQARELAVRENVDIRYYSIIYDVTDDLAKMILGRTKPKTRERFLGNAQILEVFNITKVGKVAGCRVTEGMVRRGARVRLLRDNVVIHEGSLSTLKRFKDEVREVRDGLECGMAFENYSDIKQGDVIECFEMEEVAPAVG